MRYKMDYVNWHRQIMVWDGKYGIFEQTSKPRSMNTLIQPHRIVTTQNDGWQMNLAFHNFSFKFVSVMMICIWIGTFRVGLTESRQHLRLRSSPNFEFIFFFFSMYVREFVWWIRNMCVLFVLVRKWVKSALRCANIKNMQPFALPSFACKAANRKYFEVVATEKACMLVRWKMWNPSMKRMRKKN